MSTLRSFSIAGIAMLFIILSSFEMTAQATKYQITKKVFLDIEIDGTPAGRIEIGLFGTTVPLTTDNFFQLITGAKGYGYKGSEIFRAVRDFMIQGGDITNNDGTGGKSIYGPTFDDENFILDHYAAGWVSMVNSGEDSNNSQFLITTQKTGWLDGRHVVFGKVLAGMDVVTKIEKLAIDNASSPIKTVKISDCGALPLAAPFLTTPD